MQSATAQAYEITSGAATQPAELTCLVQACSADAALACAALLHEVRFGCRPTFQRARQVHNLRRAILSTLKPVDRCARCGADLARKCLGVTPDGRAYCHGCAP